MKLEMFAQEDIIFTYYFLFQYRNVHSILFGRVNVNFIDQAVHIIIVSSIR